MDLGSISTPPASIEQAQADDSDVGIRRQVRVMKARLNELETLYAARFKHQVPTATSVARQPVGERCAFHLHVVVHDHAAIVECGTCKAPLDPLAVLREFARGERNFADALEHLRVERAALKKEIEALKKQKAALRSAIRKTGHAPVDRWDLKEQG